MPEHVIKTRLLVVWVFWAMILLAGSLPTSAQEGPANSDALVLQYRPVLAPEAFKALLKLELERGGRPSRSYQIALWQKNPNLVRILFEAPPSEKGKILLRKKDTYYLALPDLGEVVQLPPSRISDWGFFYAENLFPFYFHKDLIWGPVQSKGGEWILSVRRKSDSTPWVSCTLAGPEGPLTRVALFDPSGKKLRTVSIEWEGTAPQERPKRMEVENHLPEPYRARIRIEELRLKPVFPDRAFEIDLPGPTEK
jgi:outer membrane lipoprotein-sorting protein